MPVEAQERGGTDDPAPLIETKLAPPRVRPNILVRTRLERLLDVSAPAALTLVDAPVGSGKTMLVQSWCASQSGAVALGVARCRRRRSGALLDISGDCRRPRQAGPRPDGPAQAAHARRLDHGRRRRARERAGRLRGAGCHRARRSPRPVQRGELRLARIRSGAAPVQRPRDRDHARRPARRPGQAARSRHARRDPLSRACVHGRGGARIPGRRRGNGARRCRRGATRRAHRGLARRPLPGGALAARPRRSRRGRARLRRRSPSRRRVPDGRGARCARARAARFPAAQLRSQPLHRRALRPRPRADGLGRDAGRDRALEPLPGGARSTR